MHKNGTALHPQTPMSKPIARKGEGGEGGIKIQGDGDILLFISDFRMARYAKMVKINTNSIISHISYLFFLAFICMSVCLIINNRLIYQPTPFA